MKEKKCFGLADAYPITNYLVNSVDFCTGHITMAVAETLTYGLISFGVGMRLELSESIRAGLSYYISKLHENSEISNYYESILI